VNREGAGTVRSMMSDRWLAGWVVLTAAASAMGAAACGGAGSPPGTKNASDVQASKMGETFAGQNRCNPKNHERPFIIEWDATDMSSFESRAAVLPRPR
jgi:hypothetical protein